MVTYSKQVTDSDELYVRCNYLGNKYKVIFLTVEKGYDSKEYSLEIRFTDRPCAYNESSEEEFNKVLKKVRQNMTVVEYSKRIDYLDWGEERKVMYIRSEKLEGCYRITTLSFNLVDACCSITKTYPLNPSWGQEKSSEKEFNEMFNKAIKLLNDRD